MKRQPNHYQRKAWIIVLPLPATVVIGVLAGFIVQWLH